MPIDVSRYEKIIVHEEPAWRQNADYIFFAEFKVDGRLSTEQLWGRQIDSTLLEVCCIPFLVEGISLGDFVRIEAGMMQAVVKRNGRRVVRVWFYAAESARSELVEELQAKGCLVEQNMSQLFAFDVPNEQTFIEVLTIVEQAHQSGLIDYETE